MTNDWSRTEQGAWQFIVRLPCGATAITKWQRDEDPSPEQRTWVAEEAWQRVLDQLEARYGNG